MSEDSGKSSGAAVPIAVDRRLLAGEGLSAGDLSEFDDEDISPEDPAADFQMHNVHTGSIWCLFTKQDPEKSESKARFTTNSLPSLRRVDLDARRGWRI